MDSTQTSPFAGIAGNEPALRFLARAADSGSSHAYLFHGPSGVGKRTVARLFGARLVSGGDDSAERRARNGNHPDLSEIPPEGNFTTIEQIREVVRLASSRPFEGARRVIVLDADSFRAEAANALLKTLEEPDGETVFVLLSSSLSGVMPTIVSRAQPVRFDRVPERQIKELLASRGVGEPEVAAALGRGSIGLALRYAGEVGMRDLREVVFRAGMSAGEDFEGRHAIVSEVIERVEAVGKEREKAVLDSAEEPDKRVRDRAKRVGRAARDHAYREALDLLAVLYRDAGVTQAGAEELVANVDRVEDIRLLVDRHPDADWAGAALSLEEARAGLTYNVSPEAMLEVALSRTRRRILGRSRG
ncbi:ATP-binding protein [Rubrobacter indicoceani]|uniref:DNA polymerase III subunit n=1 Tax=Rubrobacter indicoceani TaxID=2051957 RepID=UPI0013C460DC|nr:DNA polymerase III subunit delta' [Rubrobacter indicoceani]